MTGDGAASTSSTSTFCRFERRTGTVGSARDDEATTSGLGSRRAAFLFRETGGGCGGGGELSGTWVAAAAAFEPAASLAAERVTLEDMRS